MLEVEGLYADYGQIEVLHGLSFQVPKGQVVTLIGSNGAGKTTTMRALSGMIRPRAGTIRLNGREIGGLDSPRRRPRGARPLAGGPPGVPDAFGGRTTSPSAPSRGSRDLGRRAMSPPTASAPSACSRA